MDATRRTAVATTVFSTWVVLGLFIDGWAHNAGKPEDFWTPWHGVLYSGFAVGVVWFAASRRRERRHGPPTPIDPLTAAGFVLFAVGGLGDAVWHSILGVEEDVAALLSPTHLALMVGGLLLICGPLRRPGEKSATFESRWRSVVPDAVAITLAVAVVGFFLQFLSAFHGIHPARYQAGGSEADHLLGVASVLVTNVLVVAAVAFIARRRDLLVPGVFTLLLGATTLLWSSLEAFEGVALTAAAVSAGVVADILSHRGAGTRVLALTTPVALWLLWFAIYHARWGLGWPAEYWAGVTVLAVLTGWGIDLLQGPSREVDPGSPPAGTPRWVEPQVTSTDGCVTTPTAGGS